jgi:hypothetical protein
MFAIKVWGSIQGEKSVLLIKQVEIFSDPDFPEQECPEYGHRDSEAADNRTTDQRVNL